MMAIDLRCAACGAGASAGVARCLSCGGRLPAAGAFEGGVGPRAVREVLAAAGVAGEAVRVDDCTWRFARPRPSGGTADVTVRLSAGVLTAAVAVAGLPAAGHESLYRALLTLNDATTGLFRIALRDDGTIELCLDEPTSPLREREVAALLDDLVRHADHWQRRLSDAFDVPPPA